MKTNYISPFVTSLAIAATIASPIASAEQVRIALIETMSGAFAALGQNEFQTFQMATEIAARQKWAGDNSIEFVTFDGKGSPQESLRQFKIAADQGFRYVAQGNGSGVALALSDAVTKHNERNPGKEILYLNYGAIDPDLTNYKCSFWHFRFDSNTDMKMEALTSTMEKNAAIKKVFIIGQNYAHGHQFSKAAKELLQRKRPDIDIVGNDFHPIGQIKDFSPYVAKIKASGADTVLTGNWGADLALLIKASKDAGLNVNFYTFYANLIGTPTAIGAAGADRVKVVANWHPNNETFSGKELVESFKKKHNEDFFFLSPYSTVEMLSKAIKESKSIDPIKVALAMEGMKVKGLNGENEMRKSDHQMQQSLYVATWTKANGKDVRFDQDKTGYGWKTDKKIESFV
ncbi:MAG TPA: branched-chain amino acid ABC transporter substrate-binding protein, partial [Pirellula sp.]|nr:branched-chain amino acid ABC transporter substrate-binding protein [Pirellula sp.]